MESVTKMNSIELVNLLASHGIRTPHRGSEDIRKASVYENGVFTNRSFVKVVVSTGNETMMDYGVRLLFDKSEYDAIKQKDAEEYNSILEFYES